MTARYWNRLHGNWINMMDEEVIDEFNRLWYARAERGHMAMEWRGIKCIKCPTDLIAYAEIIQRTKPQLIIETGTCNGGSALFLADMMRCAGIVDPWVATVDNGWQGGRPNDPNIFYFDGSSTSPEFREWLDREFAGHGRRTMVILDSDHHTGHVLDELRLLSPYVSRDCYLVVEDTNISGHPVYPSAAQAQHPGPWEAVSEFLMTEQGKAFEVDPHPTRFLLTWNPGGYLRRVD